MSKKHIVFNTIFSRFFIVLASENVSKIEVFSHFFRRRRLFENQQKPLKKTIIFIDFSGSAPPKIHPTSIPKRARKKHRKTFPKNRFWLPFWPPKILPKSTQHRKNSKKVAFGKKLKKTTSANHRPGPQTTRKSSLLGPRRTIQPPFQ